MTTTEPHDRATPDLRIAIGGMTCAGCASTVQRGIAMLDGIAAADVNIATRRATVRPDGTIDADELQVAIEAAIEGLGFSILTKGKVDVGGEETDTQFSLADEHAAHTRADDARVADHRRRFWFAAALTIPLLAISMIPALQFPGWGWVACALATPVYLWSAGPFHRSALESVRRGQTSMDTLISLGTTVAWVWSSVVLIGGAAGVAVLQEAPLYFEEAGVIIAIIQLGKWIEVRSMARAGDAIRALSRRQVDRVTLADGREIPLAELAVGDRFLVRPGETIATDGVVVEGEAGVDVSLVTGESAPVHVAADHEVVGGTVAVDGALTVEAQRIGSDTMLAQIARMVDEAQSGKVRVQKLADRISAVFVPTVVVLSIATLVAWLIAGADMHSAVTAGVAVLIISCPCALGLATPLAIMVGTGRGAQFGVLVRSPQVLEDTRLVDTVVFDKTGTVTAGDMRVANTFTGVLPDDDGAQLLDAAASVEARSEHPVAAAIARAVPRRMKLKGFRNSPGRGVTATVQGAALGGDDVDVTVGAASLFDEIPTEVVRWAEGEESQGRTVVFVGRAAVLGGGLLGGGALTRASLAAEAAISVEDTVKPMAREVCDDLAALGIDVVLLTGDNKRAAHAVAQAVGIRRVYADVLPGDKADVVRALQTEGKRVAMVGDGVNDAPALAQADLGIAIGTGADVARQSSDISLVSGDLHGVPIAVRLSRRTLQIIKGNLFWAFAYNVAAMPLAAFGIVGPTVGAFTMGLSNVMVVGNSLRLRRYDPLN